MVQGQKIRKLVLLSKRIEDKLPVSSQLKIAKKRLMKAANIDESEVEKIKKETLQNKVEERKEKVVTNFELLQDVQIKSKEEPENESLREEVDRKETDLEFAVEDLVRAEKESRGEDPNQILPAKIRKAGTDDPQEYGKESFVQKDNSKSSSEQKDDDAIEKIIKNTSKEDKERFILEE